MKHCYSMYSSCCELAKLFIEKALAGIEAYTLIAEPLYKIPRVDEVNSSMSVWNDCSSLCNALHIVNRGVNNAKLCILGPKTTRIPENCDSYGGPEPAVWYGLEHGLNILYITGDLDLAMTLLSEVPYAVRVGFIHVHSDNTYRLWHTSPLQHVVYTSQVCTPSSTLPLGGFTDGDRAVIVGMILDAKEILIHGYCGEETYWYKDLRRPSWKERKTRVMSSIIDYVARRMGYRLKRANNCNYKLARV